MAKKSTKAKIDPSKLFFKVISDDPLTCSIKIGDKSVPDEKGLTPEGFDNYLTKPSSPRLAETLRNHYMSQGKTGSEATRGTGFLYFYNEFIPEFSDHNSNTGGRNFKVATLMYHDLDQYKRCTPENFVKGIEFIAKSLKNSVYLSKTTSVYLVSKGQFVKITDEVSEDLISFDEVATVDEVDNGSNQ